MHACMKNYIRYACIVVYPARGVYLDLINRFSTRFVPSRKMYVRPKYVGVSRKEILIKITKTSQC